MSPPPAAADRGAVRTLLVSPPWNETVDRACLERVAAPSPGECDVVVVSSTRSADAVVDDWRAHLGERPRNLGVVDLGDAMRSVAPSRQSAEASEVPNVAVSLPDRRDTSDLLEAVSRFLADWGDGGGRPVAYVDSVTGLLDRTGLASAVGFVDSLGTLLDSNGGAAFYRIEERAHDARTLGVLDPFFDAVLRLADGEPNWSEPPTAAAVADPGASTSADRAFSLLADRRRRLVLHGLRTSGGPMSLSALATFVANVGVEPGEEPSTDAYSRVYTGLWNDHLPALDAAGVVSFDEASNTVELADRRLVEPYLSMAVPEDLHG